MTVANQDYELPSFLAILRQATLRLICPWPARPGLLSA